MLVVALGHKPPEFGPAPVVVELAHTPLGFVPAPAEAVPSGLAAFHQPPQVAAPIPQFVPLPIN